MADFNLAVSTQTTKPQNIIPCQIFQLYSINIDASVKCSPVFNNISLNHIVQHTVQRAEKIVSAHFCIGRKDGWCHSQIAVHMVADRFNCKKGLWLAPGGPILTLAARMGLNNAFFTLKGVLFYRVGCLGPERWLLAKNPDYRRSGIFRCW